MPTVTYPLDTSGVSPLNLIPREVHTVSEAQFRDYYFIVPNFAPFFVDNFKLVLLKDGVEHTLNEDVDWSFAIPYITGTRVTGKQMYGAITLHNLDVDGILFMDYQTIGGDQVCDRLYVLTYLADKAYNPRTTVWDVVTNVPNAFPPVPHYQDYDQFFGQEAVVQKLGEIRDAIAANSSLTAQKVEEFLQLFTGVDMSGYLLTTGDTMTGKLILEQLPTNENDAVPKRYVDDNFVSNSTLSTTMSQYYNQTAIDEALAQKLGLGGGELTGALTLAGDPTADFHAATKKYVDDAVTDLQTQIDNIGDAVTDLTNNGATKEYVDQRLNEIMAFFTAKRVK